YLVNADSSGLMRLVAKGSDARWSPDGNAIAFLSDSCNDAKCLEVAEAKGGKARQLSNGDGFVWSFAWSPDGKRIAYAQVDTKIDGGVTVLNVVREDGSGQTRLTSDAESEEPTWSPDGRRIAFTRFPDTPRSAVYAIDPDGSNLRLLVKNAFRP